MQINISICIYIRDSPTYTRFSVLHQLVGDRKFAEVVAGHLGLDFDRVEDLAVVDTDDGANHLWDDNHVAEVGLDDGGLLVWRGLLLGLAELLDEAHGFALETALEPTAGAGVDDLAFQTQAC